MTDATDPTPLRRALRPRWWLDVPLVIAGLLLALVGALRWWDTTAPWVSVLQTLGPFVVMGLLALLVVALLARRAVPALLALVLVGGAATQAVPPFLAHDLHPRAPVSLTVMSANLWVGRANPRQLAAAIRLREPDVVMLQEITPEAYELLVREGVRADLPYAVGTPRPDASGTVILSSSPIRLVDPGTDPRVTGSPFAEPVGAIRLRGGREVTLRAVHTMPPIGGAVGQWRAGLYGLQRWRESLPAGGVAVMAGDFNAGSGHPGFRAAQGDWVDAHRAAGLGWVRTWPFAGQRVPAFVQIDHVLSRGLHVVAAGTTAINGTDHAIVWARYALPGS